MGTSTTARQVFRQRSSLVLAAVCGVTGALLLLSLVRNWAHYPRPVFLAWVLLGLALTWAVFVRPAVLLDSEGVTLQNVLRDIRIPWARLSHVETRWNLRVFVEDRGYTAWAISSEIERPNRGGISGLRGRRAPEAGPGTRQSASVPRVTVPKVNAHTVARSIEQAQRDYEDSLSRGRHGAVSSGGAVSNGEVPDGDLSGSQRSDDLVRIRWVPLVVAVLLVPAIAVAALSLG
jgi:hypothetical protein